MLQHYAIVPTLPASDLDRAKRFYAEKLGLLPEREDEGAAHYRTGAVTFDLYPTQHAGTAHHTLAAWEVDDIDDVVDWLRARGVVFEEYDAPGLKTHNGIATLAADRVAWFKDSEGNILAIAQPLPATVAGDGTASDQTRTGEQQRSVAADPWGVRARDWAEIEDEGSRELFEAVLDLAGVTQGTNLLDVGCGSGLACALAAARGADVSGLDTSPGLLAIARERVPAGDFRVGDMVSLPWPDGSFDVVAFVNAIFFATDVAAALREAARTARRGGRIAVVSWSAPEKVESVAYLAALQPLLPPLPMEVNPFIAPEQLEELARGAGLVPDRVVDLDWTWRYPDLETAVRGWLSPGLSAVAIAATDERKVTDAVTAALAPFEQPGGGYRLDNLVHCLIATA